ncbi:MAG TPA: carboxypeptidase regulatory-like domain-containing protein [Terriglobales bacterium]|jgi:protocatechuate 3,4-dioxygenase beta subunit|nr:carboxypeptidase regulatory-like domain-containing protein [Terriglobales bacterium]
MRAVTVAICLLLPVASFAQVPAMGNPAQKQPALCTVSGQVVTAAEGVPLKSSRIALIQQDTGSHSSVFAATTDSEGRFEIKKIAPGRYGVFASHAGYLTQQYQARGSSGGAVLNLTPGQEVGHALFRLVRAAVVAGRIVDESGEPMAGLVVMAMRRLSVEDKEEFSPQERKVQVTGSSAAVTDDRGEYRIFALKPGEYYVKAAESDAFPFFAMDEDNNISETVRRNLGSQYAAIFYPGVVQLDQAQSLELGPGEEVEADFTMRNVRTVEVAGRVLAPDGKPTTHAYVNLNSPEVGGGVDEFTAGTGAKGEFSIKGVPPGSYVLSAQQHDENGFHMAQQKLEVGNDNLDSVVIAFGKGTTISGRIVPAGAGTNGSRHIQIQIVLELAGESDSASFAGAKVKEDGSFEITDVPDGNYALEISGIEQGWYMKSARLGEQDVLQKGLALEQGPSGGTLEIVLSSASARLEGTVLERDQPVGGAQVRARPDPETAYNRARGGRTTTDQNGHFTFDPMPPGKYRITAKLPSASPETPAVTSEPETVTLGEHDHKAVELMLATPQNQ